MLFGWQQPKAIREQVRMEKYLRLLTTIAATTFATMLSLSPVASLAKELTFGYVPGSMSYPFNVATARGFEAEAKAAGVKTVVLDPKGDVSNQGNDIDDLLARHVDAIGFLPLDSVVATSFVNKIDRANIPVVAVALQVGNPAERSLRDVYPGLSALVAPDDVIEGERAGQLALGLLPKGRVAKIGIIEGAPGYAVVTQRTKGFEDALNAGGAKYKVVSAQPTDWSPEQGEAVCQNMLTAHPDIDLIFSQADDMAIGCSRAIDSLGTKTQLIATGGGSRLGNSAIASGDLDGSVCVKPELLGRLMFKAMYEAATAPSTPHGRFITIDTPIITKANLNSCPAQW
jgi:ribose transport system substrate-binding protein